MIVAGETDKINPKNVIDSIEAETSEISEPENEDERDQIKNRFKNAKKMTKPKSSNEQLLHFLEKQHDHDKKMEERREKHFHSLEKILEQQSEQRERMLKILEKGMRKRKHSDSE
jgi:glutamate/tyrosine decarboxylase-like PLP-dependent enzyme